MAPLRRAIALAAAYLTAAAVLPRASPSNASSLWQISDLRITQSPATPGNYASLAGVFRFLIRAPTADIDPNNTALSPPSAICSVRWYSPVETLWNDTHECIAAADEDQWWFRIQQNGNVTSRPPSPLNNFRLCVMRAPRLQLPVPVPRALVGAAGFEVNKDLEESCQGLLNCTYYLRPSLSPVFVRPNLTACEDDGSVR